MGLSRAAVEADDELDIAELVRHSWATGRRVDYVIVDEAQFFTVAQIEQLARLADGVVATEGEQVVVADTAAGSADVRYQVLCRAHHRAGNLGPASGGGTLPLVDGS